MSNMSSLQWALIGDALSLGPHWIYDQNAIAEKYPNGVSNYSDPMASYHGEKKAGDFSHYGDQTLSLFLSLQNLGRFDRAKFLADWKELWEEYPGYIDGATKSVLSSLEAGAYRPSISSDLGGAARVAAVSSALDDVSIEGQVKVAREQTLATHDDGSAADAAEFLVMLNNESTDQRGIMKTLSDNALAGGDTCARALAIGMVLGAAFDGAMPDDLIDALSCNQ